MANTAAYTRPSLEKALQSWKALLKRRGFPDELTWLFDENLCFEKDPKAPGGFRLGFQTAFTPPPPGAERIAYEHFAGFDAPLVFYRLGSHAGKSICVMLCDPWFEHRTEADGFAQTNEWRMAFRTGGPEEIEEIADRARWENRLVRDRPLHDLDFCMSLRAVHETLAHGRVLTTYERFALRLTHVWRRWLGNPD